MNLAKNIYFSLLFFLIGSVGATTIDVVAWNIKWFPGHSFEPAAEDVVRKHVKIVQEQIEKMDPDVLLSSEIRNWKYFEEAVSRLPELKVVNVSHFVDREFGVLWRQQLAIASTLPVIAAWAESWQPTITSLSRGFSFAAIEIPGTDGKLVLFYALHLKSNRANNERETLTNYRLRNESTAQLIDHIDRMTRLMWKDQVIGVVVGGDINTNEDGQFGDHVVEMMLEAGFTNTWANTPKEKRYTWRGSELYPPTTFDYIFVRGEGLEFGEAELIEVPEEASDHHAVRLEITVR